MPNPMFVYDDGLADLILDYCRERLALDPAPLDYSGDRVALTAALDGLIGAGGTDPARVLDLFAEHLATAVISCDSPRFLSFIPAAPTKAALLFDMVVSCSSLQGISWLEASGAVAAENQALRVIADLAGLPPGAGGCFVSGGTMGNLSALVVARDHAPVDAGARPRIAISEEAHASVSRALHVLGVEPLLVPTVEHRLQGDALEAAIDGSAADGPVVAVVATAGTTNAGLVDDLDGVGRVAAERGLWLHVDAAYGGGALFAPSVRDRFAGIERADSLVVDPHKWLFAPFDCAALLYRAPELARETHAQQASYLDVIHDEGAWNPSDYALHLTRRARGLPLWFSLAVNGLDAYRDAVEAALRMARLAADAIERHDHLQLLRPPELSVVLFRRVGWEQEDYLRWSAALLREQTGFVTPTHWENETVARLCFLHPETTLPMVEEILATMA